MDSKTIIEKSEDKIHTLVKEKYSGIAKGNADGCAPSCCGGSPSLVNIIDLGKALDYAEKDLSLAPGEANLGLGCGNPISKAELKPGEIVLDLGSGAGFDAFLAAQRVGESGKVIGVDMTREMIEKARMNSEKLKISNVEFRLGEIEKIPVSDSSVDVVISNCVINLSPDKPAVFKEIHRTLRPGGRIIISDILRSGEMPEEIRSNPAAYTGWVSGAISPGEVKTILSDLGFKNITISRKEQSEDIIRGWNVTEGAEKVVYSAYVQAVKAWPVVRIKKCESQKTITGEEVENMAEECCVPGGNVMILACSGGSNVGQLANQAAVELTQEGFGKMYCLAGIGGHLSGFVQSAKDVPQMVAVDGCPTGCAKAILEKAEVPIRNYLVLTELGLEKNKNFQLNREEIDRVKIAVKGTCAKDYGFKR